MYDLSEILIFSTAFSLSLLVLVPSVPCSFREFSGHNLEQVDSKGVYLKPFIEANISGSLVLSSQFL